MEGRDCGGCVVCCVVPTIDDPEIQKASNTPCRHSGDGCAIYARRPRPCRVFHCAWRRLAVLDDAWRPDRSGVFSTLDPGAVAGREVLALTLMLVGDPAEIVARPAFVGFVRANMLDDLPLYLALPGPPGYLPWRVLLNSPAMAAAAAWGDVRVRAILEQAVAFMKAQPLRPYTPAHAGNDTGSAAETGAR